MQQVAGAACHTLNKGGGSYGTHFQQRIHQQRQWISERGRRDHEYNIGVLYWAQSNYEQALPYLEQGLPIAREIGNKIGESATMNNIATIYRAQGNPAKALEYYEQALAIRQQLGDRVREAITRWNIGLTYKDQGNLAKAEEYISQAVQIEEAIGPILYWMNGARN